LVTRCVRNHRQVENVEERGRNGTDVTEDRITQVLLEERFHDPGQHHGVGGKENQAGDDDEDENGHRLSLDFVRTSAAQSGSMGSEW
jgi:hypothetical protein